MFVDAHAHLCDLKNPEILVQTARKMGCVGIITCGYDMQSNIRTIEIARAFPNLIFPCIGLAPQRAMNLTSTKIDEEIGNTGGLVTKEVRGIGEVGLDYHWAREADERMRQRSAFSRMIELALIHELPLVVHSRKAEDEVVRILRGMNARKVVLHCFSGNRTTARVAVEHGFYISIPPTKSKERLKVIRSVPMNKLLIETDLPYLAKDVSGIMDAARIVAKAKDISIGEVLRRTSENAFELFGIE